MSMTFPHAHERGRVLAMAARFVAAVQRLHSSVGTCDTERALHAAIDHADLKRLMDAQRRCAAQRWWPTGG